MSFSFQPTQTTSEAPTQRGGKAVVPESYLTPRALENGTDTLRIVLISILALSVTIAVILFGYHYYLKSQIETKKSQLNEYEVKLGNLPLADYRKLSNRLKTINKLIKEHPSINVVFRILEDSVENKVAYKQFDLHFSEVLNTYELKLGAIANDYHAVINQLDTLKSKPYNTYISSVDIDNIHPDDSGNVTFSLKMPIMIKGLLPESLVLLTNTMTTQQASTTSLIPNIDQVISQPASTTPSGLPKKK